MAEAVDVGEARQVAQRQRLVGQQRVSAAFFAPEIGRRPDRRLPPRIRIRSMA
jgi:hypothetical protein